MNADDIERLTTRLENRVKASWRAIIREARDENDLATLRARIAVGDTGDLLAGLDDIAGKLAAEISNGYLIAGQRAARWLDGEVDATIRFDPANAEAIQWMSDNADRIVSQFVSEQQAVARAVVEDGRYRNWSESDIAEEVRASIGSNLQIVEYTSSYRDALEDGDWSNALDRELADGRYDQSINRAAATDSELDEDRLDSMVDRYRDNWIDRRGENIALEESNDATNAGVEELLAQASDAGDISSDDVEQEWITMNDAKVRGSHRPMSGQIRALGEDFESGSGVKLRYPGDPDAPGDETAGCRCLVERRIVGAR